MPSSFSTILSPAPTPFSPRTTSSSASHYTSDDLPDLGAFNIVLREWVHLQPYPRIPQHHSRQQRPISETYIDGSATPSMGLRSTVWDQRPIAGYLHGTLSQGRTNTGSLGSDSEDFEGMTQSEDEDDDDDDEDEDEDEDEQDEDTEGALTVEIADDDDREEEDDHDGTHLTSVGPLRRTQPSIYFPTIHDVRGHGPISTADDPDLDIDVDIGIGIGLDTGTDLDADADADAEPSLGYLDGALSFIAAERERARWSARYGTGVGDGERKWRRVTESLPHRRRHRVRKRPHARADEEQVSITEEGPASVPRGEEEEEEEDEPSTIKGSTSRHLTPTASFTVTARKTKGILYAYDSSATTTTTTAVESTSSLQPKSKPKSKSKSKPKPDSIPTSQLQTRTQSKTRPDININTTLVDSKSTKGTGKGGGKVRGISIIPMPYKILAHSRSTPVLGSIDVGVGVGVREGRGGMMERRPSPRRTRLLELIGVLKGVFPEDVVGLGEVEERLGVGGVRRKGKGKGRRNTEERVGMGSVSDGDEDEDQDRDEGMLVSDVRGRDAERERAGGREDPLIHVFVDHSNILIGLLTYLKRHPPRKNRISGDKSDDKGKESRISKPKPPKPKPPNSSGVGAGVGTLVVDDDESESESESNSRGHGGPGNIAGAPVLGKKKKGKEKGRSTSTNEKTSTTTPVSSPREYHHKTPIPLPSFATAGRALRELGGVSGVGVPRQGATQSVNRSGSGELKSKAKSKSSYLSRSKSMGATEEGYGAGPRLGDEVFGDDDDEEEEDEKKTQKRQAPRLSHTALALILERGRPITRRVLVTSSPLYQPMDTMERLGYEVRVYMRVPDLGDGMDRERHHHHHHKRGASTGTVSGSGDSPKKLKMHARRISWSTSTESASASASAGEPVKASSRSSLTFPDGSSSSTNMLSVPGSAPLITPTQSHYHHHHHHHHQYQLGSYDSPVSGKRVRYREQGVDELLQLKLHQALAATDDVPEGATIVLATGDGNVGQFSEDGFLGPVRTALRRGWKVELYAWEEGLSRAWRREFGEGSEWGRSGMFRIVRMEQFAESLVEGGL